MARRRLPKPLVPVLVGVSAAALGLLAVTPSFAGQNQPVDPVSTPSPLSTPSANPVPPTAVPSLTASPIWPDDPTFSIRPSKSDPLRDWPTPEHPVGGCADCVDEPV
jgi:hypothetical protein